MVDGGGSVSVVGGVQNTKFIYDPHEAPAAPSSAPGRRIMPNSNKTKEKGNADQEACKGKCFHCLCEEMVTQKCADCKEFCCEDHHLVLKCCVQETLCELCADIKTKNCDGECGRFHKLCLTECLGGCEQSYCEECIPAEMASTRYCKNCEE